jgi:hypothetical protein
MDPAALTVVQQSALLLPPPFRDAADHAAGAPMTRTDD